MYTILIHTIIAKILVDLVLLIYSMIAIQYREENISFQNFVTHHPVRAWSRKMLRNMRNRFLQTMWKEFFSAL